MSVKKVYAHPGDLLVVHIIIHEDDELTARAFADQPLQNKIPIEILETRAVGLPFYIDAFTTDGGGKRKQRL
jgi:hypothetical protein